jgi:FAD/FMN-containing dehydrogenase/ferredoxin
MYGPDPATHAWCTLGGMIGNNSCGVHSVVAGLTADVVEDLDVLTADGLRLRVSRTTADDLDTISREPGRRGEIYARLRELRDRHAAEIRARYPRIPRRVSGYELDALLPERHFNVARALVGTEGTCVTVLEATVRLMDAPRARALLVLDFRDIYAAADEVMTVLEAHPIGLEAIDEVLVGNLKLKAKLPREIRLLSGGNAWLLVEFGGHNARDADASARQLLAKLSRVRSSPSGVVFTDPDEIAMVWLIRESGLGATAFVPGESATWEGWEDAAVSPERLGAYLRDFRRLLNRFGYRGALYGHFGEGCVHTRTNFDLETAGGIATYRAFIDEAADLVVAYGGSLSGEHGDGQSRAELLPKMFGNTLVGAFREFKRIWDPGGLMNPGKVVDPFGATDHLRRPGYRSAPGRTFFPLAAEGGIAGAALRCVGVGKCRKTGEGTMCPSYMATGEERHSTRGRAHLLFEMLRGEVITSGWESDEVKHALDLCLACKACKSECPVSVDMATYKAEFLGHYYASRTHPIRDHLFGHIDWWAIAASRLPRLVNALVSISCPSSRFLRANLTRMRRLSCSSRAVSPSFRTRRAACCRTRRSLGRLPGGRFCSTHSSGLISNAAACRGSVVARWSTCTVTSRRSRVASRSLRHSPPRGWMPRSSTPAAAAWPDRSGSTSSTIRSRWRSANENFCRRSAKRRRPWRSSRTGSAAASKSVTPPAGRPVISRSSSPERSEVRDEGVALT